MRCSRCGGLRLWSHFANLGTAVGAWAYDGWRCMNCGDVVDALILQNRSLQQDTISVAHRVRPFGDKIVWLRAVQTVDATESVVATESQEDCHPQPAAEERRRRLAG